MFPSIHINFYRVYKIFKFVSIQYIFFIYNFVDNFWYYYYAKSMFLTSRVWLIFQVFYPTGDCLNFSMNITFAWALPYILKEGLANRPIHRQQELYTEMFFFLNSLYHCQLVSSLAYQQAKLNARLIPKVHGEIHNGYRVAWEKQEREKKKNSLFFVKKNDHASWEKLTKLWQGEVCSTIYKERRASPESNLNPNRLGRKAYWDSWQDTEVYEGYGAIKLLLRLSSCVRQE